MHEHESAHALASLPITAISRLQVRGKVNAITMDKCTRTGLLFDTGVSTTPSWVWLPSRQPDTAGRIAGLVVLYQRQHSALLTPPCPFA
jgi:hypothetical protein